MVRKKQYPVALFLFVSITSTLAGPGNAENEKVSVVYARRNISDWATITADDVAETSIDKGQAPTNAIRHTKDCIHGLSQGISRGQIIFPRRRCSGLKAGVTDFAGFQPQSEIDSSSELPAAKMGVLDPTGKWIVAPEYFEIHYVPKGFWVTDYTHTMSNEEREKLRSALGHYVYADTWQLFDHDGKKLGSTLPVATLHLEWPANGYRRLSKNIVFWTNSGKGVCDNFGHIIVTPRYESIQELAQKYLVVLTQPKNSDTPTIDQISASLKQSQFDILDQSGKLLSRLPKTVERVTSISDRGFAICTLKGRKSFEDDSAAIINFAGKTIVPASKYRFIGEFSHEGIARVGLKNQEKVGYIDLALKKLIVPPIFQQLGPDCDFRNGIALVGKETNLGGRNRKGEIVFGETKHGIINRSGKVVLPFVYDYLAWLPNDTISATKGNKSMVLDRQLKPIMSFDRNTFINWWSDGRYHGTVNVWSAERQRSQFFDETGHKVGPEFVRISDFHGNHAVVWTDREHCGLIDRSGNWILPPKYKTLEACGDDRLIAELNSDQTE